MLHVESEPRSSINANSLVEPLAPAHLRPRCHHTFVHERRIIVDGLTIDLLLEQFRHERACMLAASGRCLRKQKELLASCVVDILVPHLTTPALSDVCISALRLSRTLNCFNKVELETCAWTANNVFLSMIVVQPLSCHWQARQV